MNPSNSSGAERWLFIITLAAHLVPLWSVQYFLTTDGPSHVYNSKLLLDFFFSKDLDFYTQYFSINNNLFPNWFSHVCMGGLQAFIPGYLAEKIFLSAYVILFMVAIRQLVKIVNKENLFLSWAAFPFVFNHVLQLGFYNSLFSMAFMVLSIFIWLKPFRNLIMKMVLLSGLFTLLYFTHLMGFIFTLLFILILIPWQQQWWGHSFSQSIKNCGKRIIQLILVALPALLLARNYFSSATSSITPSGFSTKKLYHHFIELGSLMSMTEEERLFPMIVAGLFGITLLYTVSQRILKKHFLQSDGLFVCFIAATLIYFNQPGSVAGGFLLKDRLQLIPYLILIPWLATVYYPSWAKKLMMLLFACSTLILIGIRMPHYRLASEAVKEIMSVEKLIENRSTVLPLSFSFNGKTTNGEYIANKIWLFTHAGDYLGTDKKSLVLLGDYEANTIYFPLKWNGKTNPFATVGGIEDIPPHPDISGYPVTGGTIDYVVTLFLDPQNEFINHPNTQNTLKQLNEGYDLLFTSENGRAKLYGLRK